MNEGTVSHDGDTIHFRTHGDGPRTLILLNGSVFNHRQWDRAVLPCLRRTLGQGLRLVQFDYPGSRSSD